MYTVRMLRTFGAADAANTRRDSLLRAMIGLPLGMALAARFVFPAALPPIEAAVGLELDPWYAPFIGYVLLLLAPAICGMMIGFLVLDARDDGTLRALQVTPLPWGVYLLYQLGAPLLLSLAMTLIALPLSGVTALGGPELLAVCVLAAPLAPLTALTLAVFAGNKVQGLALQKVLSLALVLPVLLWFVPTPWRWLVGIVPTAWPAMVFWSLQAGVAFPWLIWLGGLSYAATLLWLLLRRFGQVVRR